MINKRNIIISILSGLFLISCSNIDDKANKKQNFLIILVDDLGYMDLGCMGSEYYETPHLDMLAEEGILFTQGYSASRVCSPSRASLMTGKFVTSHGITDYIGAASGKDWLARGEKWGRHTKLLNAEYKHELDDKHITIAELLKANGYKNFYAGKWHLGGEGSYPEDHGFEINKGGFEAGSPRGGFFSPFKNPKLDDKIDGENLTMRLADETVKFIKANKDTNFFAMLAFYAVHSPIQTTQEKWKKYRDKTAEQGISEESFGMERRYPIRIKQDNPVYGGLVESVDDAVGKVLMCLEELDIDDYTTVIFTSDNGGVASGDAYSSSQLPLRGGKGYQWEGGIRVPFIINHPNAKINGTRSDQPIMSVDLLPTICDLANVSLTDEVDGVSLVKILNGEEDVDRTLFWHYPHYGNQGGDPSSIIREGDWKLIHYWEDDSDELYNLNSISEQIDLSKDNPKTANQLKNKLFKWLESSNAVMPPINENFDQSKADSLYKWRSIEFKNKLERKRNEMLNANWKPNNDWWGSQVTVE